MSEPALVTVATVSCTTKSGQYKRLVGSGSHHSRTTDRPWLGRKVSTFPSPHEETCIYRQRSTLGAYHSIYRCPSPWRSLDGPSYVGFQVKRDFGGGIGSLPRYHVIAMHVE